MKGRLAAPIRPGRLLSDVKTVANGRTVGRVSMARAPTPRRCIYPADPIQLVQCEVTTAWGDESQSNSTLDPGTYILAVALTFNDDIETIREGMTKLLLPGNRKVHWRDDSAARHRWVANTIAELPVEGFVVVRHAPQDSAERSRRKCLPKQPT